MGNIAIAVGIDPGSTTGVALWGEVGPVLSWQGRERSAILDLIRWMQSHPGEVVAVTIEQAWLGPGAHASLEVASHVGFCRCAVWCGGYTPEPWLLLPSQWRSDLGFPRLREQAEASALAWARDQLRRALPASHVHEAEATAMASVAWDRWRLTRERGSQRRAVRPRRRPRGGSDESR